MKWIIFAFSFLLVSCEPYSLDNERKPRFRDDAKGETEFELPDVEDINPEEVRQNKEGCESYDNHLVKNVFLGDKAPLNKMVNCIAYNIDKGLKPICEAEELAQKELRQTRDDHQAEEIEIYLDELQNEKELFIDYIYELADPIYDYCGRVEDSLGDTIDEKVTDDISNTLARFFFVDVAVNGECRRVYRIMESKVNLSCVNLDFSSFNRK